MDIFKKLEVVLGELYPGVKFECLLGRHWFETGSIRLKMTRKVEVVRGFEKEVGYVRGL